MAALISRTIILPLLTSAVLAQVLPKPDAFRDFDFEPKLMLNDLPDRPLPADPTAPTTAARSLDVAKLEAEWERAKKTAARHARLCKSGVLSKVEAEQSALKVVRLAKDLQNARLAAATIELEEKRKRATAGDLSGEALAEAEAMLVTLAAADRAAAVEWDEAQRSAAELRVQRERKLLAVGAGSRSAVKRAEASLQGLAPRTSP